jgi:tetratricopeptide (TPR) repeat protein
MKPNIKKLTTIIFMIFLFYGCGMKTKATQETRQPDKQSASFFKSNGKYYYFTEAQIQKKRGNYSEAVKYIQKAIERDPESIYLHKELTILYLYQKENQKALQVVEQILKKYPDNIDFLSILGKINQGMRNLDNAKNAYEKVLKLDPKQKEIYLILGSLYMNKNDKAKALKVYKNLVKNFPKSYVGYFFLGKIYAETQYIKSEKAYKKALEIEPALEEARFELIQLYINNKKWGNVEKLYKEILEKDPDNIKAGLGLGLYYAKNREEKKAENLFKQFGERSLLDSNIIRHIFQHYLVPKRFDDASVILEGMLKGAPDSSNLHYLAGMTFDGLKDHDTAIAHFKLVTPDSKFYENSATHVFFLYQQQGKIDEAIAALKKVIKNIPDNPELFLYLGIFYEEAEEYEKAVDAFKNGIKIDPENTRLLFRLGVVYDKWGKRKKSIESMQSVIKIDPEHADALNYIGYTYADSGENLDEAERLILKALKHKPDDGYIIDSLGWVYYQKGLFRQAVTTLEKAVSIVPDDPVIMEHLGDAYLKINKKKKALEVYRNSLKLKKKNVKVLLEKIKKLEVAE